MAKLGNASSGVFTDGCFEPYNEGISKYTLDDTYKWTLIVSLITLVVITLSFRQSKNRYLASFDARRHFLSIFDTDIRDGEITMYHGLRTLTMLVVVLFHSFTVKMSNIEPNSDIYDNWSSGKHFMKIYLPSAVVDIFFVMSSILATRAVLKYMKKGKYDYLRSVISRYLRIITVVAFALVINNFLSATLKNTFDCFDSSCQRWWWKTLLLIQNLFVDVRTEQLCLLWLWYVAVDFHMFITAPALTYLLWRYGQKMVPLAAAIVFVGVMYRFHVLASFGDEWIERNLFDDYLLSQQLVIFQFQTSMRFTPYIVGVIFGFYMDRMEEKKSNIDKLPNCLLVIFWIVPWALMGFLALIFYSNLTTSLPENFVVRAYPFIDLIFKVFGSLSVGWGTLACYFGRDRFSVFINTTMSCKFFRVTSKFCFGVYLIHFIIQLLVVHYKTEYSTFAVNEMLPEMAMELSLSILFSMYCYVFIELPICELNRKLMTATEYSNRDNNHDNNNHTLKEMRYA